MMLPLLLGKTLWRERVGYAGAGAVVPEIGVAGERHGPGDQLAAARVRGGAAGKADRLARQINGAVDDLRAAAVKRISGDRRPCVGPESDPRRPDFGAACRGAQFYRRAVVKIDDAIVRSAAARQDDSDIAAVHRSVLADLEVALV